MSPSKLLFRDAGLFPGVILCPQDLVHPPLVAGRGRKHAAHQVVVAVRVGKGMQRVVPVHTEAAAGNKDGP